MLARNVARSAIRLLLGAVTALIGWFGAAWLAETVTIATYVDDPAGRVEAAAFYLAPILVGFLAGAITGGYPGLLGVFVGTVAYLPLGLATGRVAAPGTDWWLAETLMLVLAGAGYAIARSVAGPDALAPPRRQAPPPI